MENVRSISDRYDVIEKLGEGASAETFLAKDKENGDHLVAIKSLRVEKIEGWKFFELFERESDALRSLSHAGIPQFVESFASEGEDGKPRFHLVLEYIEGKPLSDIIDSGGLSEMEFDQLAMGLLDVLDYLHSRTPPIFHRDIKPSNIIVRPMGSPVLIDFGSVCYGWREEMEQGSTVAGTHGYMPPEQYMGQVSSRSDIYGLGATLLHVASGRSPADYSFEEGRIEVPESLPVQSNIRDAIAAMLEPAPKERPQSARDVRALMIKRGSRDTTLVVAKPTSLPVPVAHFAKRPDVPTFVDVGPPPRDPENPTLRGVYYTLVPRITSSSFGVAISSRDGYRSLHILWVLLTLVTAGTMLVIPAFYLTERKRRHRLFVNGEFTTGQILGTGSLGQAHARVTFQFEVEGEMIRGSTSVTANDASHFVAGDVCGVLFHPENRSNSVIIYA